MLEKIEGAIKNEQSRETCNIGHKIENKDKQNKNTTHKTKKMRNIDFTKNFNMI